MKRILIVDDEKTLVDTLKEGFRRHEKKLFQTDVAYTAENAIKMIKTTTYELVVSDIRLPQKSGVDILIELKRLQPEAGFIAMTAFSSPEVELQVKQLGGLKYLEKPFSFDVLEDLVLGLIKKGKKGVSGTVESLELTSILQLINMEGKSTLLWIKLDGKKGYFAFAKGEIVDARFDNLSGIEAAKYLIARNEGEIRIDSKRQVRNRTISIPFMNLLLDTMKEKDERGRKDSQKAGKKKTASKTKKRKQQPGFSALKKELSQELRMLSDVKGFVNASAFEAGGKCFFEISPDEALSLKEIGVSFVTLFKKASNAISGADFGIVEMIQVDSAMGILLAKSIQFGPSQIGLLVHIGLKGNLAMAKKGLAQAVSALEKGSK